MNKRSLLNHFENVFDKGYSLDSPDQKAGPAGGLHFVTQNAYLAKTLGVKRRQSFLGRRRFAAARQTGKKQVRGMKNFFQKQADF